MFVAWPCQPIRLGIVYCWNRRSQFAILTTPIALINRIFAATLDAQAPKLTEITSSSTAARSPSVLSHAFVLWSRLQFNPSGQRLVWLESKVGGPHIGGTQLRASAWPFADPETIVDISSFSLILALHAYSQMMNMHLESTPIACPVARGSQTQS